MTGSNRGQAKSWKGAQCFGLRAASRHHHGFEQNGKFSALIPECCGGNCWISLIIPIHPWSDAANEIFIAGDAGIVFEQWCALPGYSRPLAHGPEQTGPVAERMLRMLARPGAVIERGTSPGSKITSRSIPFLCHSSCKPPLERGTTLGAGLECLKNPFTNSNAREPKLDRLARRHSYPNWTGALANPPVPASLGQTTSVADLRSPAIGQDGVSHGIVFPFVIDGPEATYRPLTR